MSIESLKTEPVQRSTLSAAAESRGVNMTFLAALAASFVVAYLPTYLRLAGGAWASEQEGHGPIIMAMAAWAAWQQRDRLRSIELRPAPVAGWVILLLSLLVMAVTRSQDLLMVEVATQIPVLLGCLLLIGGWKMARVFAFPLAFLVFSVPPPGWLLDAFTVPLKAWVSDIVSNFLYDIGYPVAQNGVMIMIGSYELMVKDACSGMNSIFVLPAIGVFYIHEFVQDDLFRKIILVLSTVPIAILANCFRVLALVLGAYYFGVDRIEGLFHDATGLALWVFALILFFILDRILVVAGLLIRNALGRGRARGAA
ncbi:MAG TPA: exosortase [Roseiarcus sp.]|jgi:exosortase B